MALVKAKCTNCGENIKVDSTKDADICPSCGTPFVVEKAINLHKTNNTSKSFNSDFVIDGTCLKQYCGCAADVVIPRGVYTIGDNAFKGCTNMRSVVLPESIVSIKKRAFYGCSDLKSITFPSSMSSIGEYAFFECTGLTSVNFPERAVLIGSSAFEGCSSLTSIKLPNAFLFPRAFAYCTKLRSVEGSFDVHYPAIFMGCTNLASISIPFGCSTIGRNAFFGCMSLKTVTFPESLEKIEARAFYGCSCLENITIPDGVSYIEDSAFGGCINLRCATIPDSVWTHDPFPGCSRLTQINASEKWKRDHFRIAECLKSYNPTPQPEGCYVATAIYGSYDCPQVWTLRRYRDYTLAETWYGRAFIRLYYAVSPTLVKWFGHTDWFKRMWKGTLDRMVSNLNAEGVKDTPYEDKNW